MRRRVFGGLLAGLLMLAAAAQAGAETTLQINGELEPKTREETLKMAEDAADAYFRDEEAAAELEMEIRKDVIPPDGDDAEEQPELPELAVYTLTHGGFSILVNPRLVDVSRPVHITTPEGEFDVTVNPSEETLRESIRKTGDPFLAWVAEIPYSLLTAAR